MIPDSGWTNERIDTMRRMLAEGHSTAVVAAFIGCSRNAVIGKVRRLEEATKERWTRRTGTTHGPRKVRMPDEGRAPRKAPTPAANFLPLMKPLPPQPPAPAVAYVPGKPATILTVTGCRWEVTGSVVTAEYRFCNGKVEDGKPYCAHHARLAVSPSSATIRKRTLGPFGMRFQKSGRAA